MSDRFQREAIAEDANRAPYKAWIAARVERPMAETLAPVTAEEETRQIRTVQPEPVALSSLTAKTETKAEDIKLDDIDKKLDEILGGDISNV